MFCRYRHSDAISPAFAGANIIHPFNISIWFFINVIFSILHKIIKYLPKIELMKSKYELEYMLNSSPKVLFPRLSTAEGLAEWFADDVHIDGNDFIFIWDNTEHRARLVQLRENKHVRFKWAETDENEDRYFEFKLDIDELTGDVALLITDFAEESEREDAIYLWDTQITELKRALGM